MLAVRMCGIGVRIRGCGATVEKRLVLSGRRVVSGSVSSALTVLGKLVVVVLKLELINVTTDDNRDIKLHDKANSNDNGCDGFLPSLEVNDA